MSGFHGNLHRRFEWPVTPGTYQAVTAAADALVLGVGGPCVVVRWGFVCSTLVNDAINALKLTGDLRATAGSDIGRVTGSTTTLQGATGYNASNQPTLFADTAGGSLTLAASASQVAAGKGVFHDMNPQAASGTPPLYPPYTASQPEDTQLEIYPGQEFILRIQATAPAAGAGRFFVEVKDLPVQYDRLGQYSSTISGPVPSNPYANMTKFFN